MRKIRLRRSLKETTWKITEIELSEESIRTELVLGPFKVWRKIGCVVQATLGELNVRFISDQERCWWVRWAFFRLPG